ILLVAGCHDNASPSADGSTADRASGEPTDDGAGGDSIGDAGGATDMAADVVVSDGPPMSAEVPCGNTTCTGDDLCVTVSTCPGAVLCTPLPDGGVCPSGTIACPIMPGCQAICPPPTSSCRRRPVACGPAISCGCINSETCSGPGCVSASGRSVLCAYQ